MQQLDKQIWKLVLYFIALNKIKCFAARYLCVALNR